ncbi:MAG: hypothetical protein QXV72_05665 [Sulfolobales archaeon]
MGDESLVDGVRILPAGKPRFGGLGHPERISKLNLLLRAGSASLKSELLSFA